MLFDPMSKENVNERVNALKAMNLLVMCVSDENLIDRWQIVAVPDGADPDDLRDIAEDEDDFRYTAKVFMEIMKSAKKDGLYIGKILVR